MVIVGYYWFVAPRASRLAGPLTARLPSLSDVTYSAAESIVNLKGEGNRWRTCREPEGDMKEHLFLTGCCNVNGVLAFPPNEHDGGDVGWLVNTGDDQKETILGMNALADELPDGLDASTETLGYVLKEIHEASKEGIEFSDKPTPEPAVVMED